MSSPARPNRAPRRGPQRAVPQSVRRSGKPLFFGWGAHLTHHEREQVKERIALAIGIALAVIVIGLLVNGWYQDNVAKPAALKAKLDKPVAQVNGQPVTYGFYHAALRFERAQLKSQIQTYQSDYQNALASKDPTTKAQATQYQSLIQQTQTTAQQAPTQTLQDLINYSLINQLGKKDANLHVSAKAVRKNLKNIEFNQFSGPANFRVAARQEGITPAQLKYLINSQYKQSQLGKQLTANKPKTTAAAKVRHILIDTPSASQKTSMGKAKFAAAVQKAKTKAEKVEGLLKAGGSWKTLALKYSQDGSGTGKKATGSKANGGNLGWAHTDGFVPAFKRAANTLPIGKIALIRSVYGFHVLQVLGRKQEPLSKTERQTQQQTAVTNWLAKEAAKKGMVKKLIHPGQAPGFPGTTPPVTNPIPTPPPAPTVAPTAGGTSSPSGHTSVKPGSGGGKNGGSNGTKKPNGTR